MRKLFIAVFALATPLTSGAMKKPMSSAKLAKVPVIPLDRSPITLTEQTACNVAKTFGNGNPLIPQSLNNILTITHCTLPDELRELIVTMSSPSEMLRYAGNRGKVALMLQAQNAINIYEYTPPKEWTQFMYAIQQDNTKSMIAQLKSGTCNPHISYPLSGRQCPEVIYPSDGTHKTMRSISLAFTWLTPLHFAIARGHLHAIQVLIHAGADVNGKCLYHDEQPTPWCLSRELLWNGGHLSPLCIAARRNNPTDAMALVKTLLKKVANPNDAEDGTYSEALSSARHLEYSGTIQILLDAGAKEKGRSGRPSCRYSRS